MDLKSIYQYITNVINNIKKNTQTALSIAKTYLEKVLLVLKKTIRITKTAINQMIETIKRLIKKLSQVAVKTIVLLVVALILMCKISINVAKAIWNWLTKTKAGQITWNAIWVVVSLAGLIVSIIGCGTPAAPAAIAGIVLSAVSLFGSVMSLFMAIFS